MGKQKGKEKLPAFSAEKLQGVQCARKFYAIRSGVKGGCWTSGFHFIDPEPPGYRKSDY